jgi:hypothetical protein
MRTWLAYGGLAVYSATEDDNPAYNDAFGPGDVPDVAWACDAMGRDAAAGLQFKPMPITAFEPTWKTELDDLELVGGDCSSYLATGDAYLTQQELECPYSRVGRTVASSPGVP